MSSTKQVTAATVREWAKANLSAEDHKCLSATARGKLSPAVVEAFHKANRGKRYTPGNRPTVAVSVPAKDKRGRNITRTVQVSPAELRTLAGAEGKRGRLSRQGIEAATLALSTPQEG